MAATPVALRITQSMVLCMLLVAHKDQVTLIVDEEILLKNSFIFIYPSNITILFETIQWLILVDSKQPHVLERKTRYRNTGKYRP